jgi:Ca-activated chloride channel family protein
MKPGQIPPWFGGTAIGKALLACRRVLTAREEGDRMIILVSDGESADLFGGTDVEIARSLKAANIVVFSIHVGDSRVPDAIVNITHLTGGEVFEAGDRQGLTAIFHRIDLMVPTRLEKIRGESIDYYLPFCLAGLAVLSLGGLSLLGARYTPW